MNEVTVKKKDYLGFDGKLRKKLRDYNINNQVYGQVDLSETIQYKNILLVGSTGYLGIHLLNELLENTNAMIYLLIRGKNDNEAGERLWAKLKFYFNDDKNWYERWKTRICIFSGDLSKEYLGLNAERYLELSEKIDCIINSAAKVKLYGQYSDFCDVNVRGNQRLIEFANTGKKTYNFISTTGLGSGCVDGEVRVVFTEYDCNVGQSFNNYYSATKLEAEELILKSREKGLDANIFRVGNLSFESTSGVFQENIVDNGFYALIKSLIKIGCFPEMKKKTIDFSFIDYVAKAIVLLFNRHNLQNETYHIFNDHQISMAFLAKLLKQTEMSVNTIPTDRFIKYLLEKYEDEKTKNYIVRVLIYLNTFFEGATKTSFIIRNQKTERILKTLNFKWPELDHRKVNLMIGHCKKVGFM
jgi:thioester reductase-like protein